MNPKQVEFDPIWKSLSVGLKPIISLTPGQGGCPLREDIFKLCTCVNPHCERLYNALRTLLEDHLKALKEQILNAQSDFLLAYAKNWKNYSTGCEYLHAIFDYLNRYWIDRNKSTIEGVYPVIILSLRMWRDTLFQRVRDKVLLGVLGLIEKERKGESISSADLDIGNLIQTFIKLGSVDFENPLGLYTEEFQGRFLEDTREFYARESSKYIEENGVSAYMEKAELRLKEEDSRSKKYLNFQTHPLLMDLLETVLIRHHQARILGEADAMFRADKTSDLQRMYSLLNRVHSNKELQDVFDSFATHYGLNKIKSTPNAVQDPATYVEELLSIHEKLSDFVNIFANDPLFIAAMDKAFRKIVNDQSKSSELIAKYCDIILRKGSKNLEEAALCRKLDQIITVFKYIDDKDIFQKFYLKMLARRLIQELSVSDDSESHMIANLRQACGYEYTSKLQRMFHDMSVSSDLNQNFKKEIDNLKAANTPIVDFSVLVLTTGSWPLHNQSPNYVVPTELAQCMNAFERFYHQQYNGRRLNWLQNHCKGTLKTLYLAKKYEIQVTNFQLGCLLLFNRQDQATVEDFRTATGIREQELPSILLSLVKSKLLLKNSKVDVGANKVEDKDSLSLNPKYDNKKQKFKIAALLQAETHEENVETHRNIEEDRKLYLQAAIVRVMKARKELTHGALISEVIQQASARFVPNIPMIKKCIETLIEKEYLRRIEGQANHYAYIA